MPVAQITCLFVGCVLGIVSSARAFVQQPAGRRAITQAAQVERWNATTGAGELRFERVRGLSHNTVFAILQDRKGFLWIGTADGLNRFDGYQFVTYRHAPADSTSLRNNVVRALAEDERGRIWVGTEGGLDEYDGVQGRFIHRTVGPVERMPGYKVPSSFLLEPSSGGTVWVGTPKYLDLFDPATDTAERFTEPFGAQPEAPWYSASTASDGTMWVAIEGSGIWKWTPVEGSFRAYDVPEGMGDGLGVLVGRSGTVWLASHSALATYDPVSDAFSRVEEGAGGQHLVEDRNGNLWIGGATGLWRYDVETRAFTSAFIEGAETSSLARRVQALYEDRAGTIWVGSLGGLFRLDPHRTPFSVIRHDPGNATSVSSNTVTAVYRDREGSLWLGTLGGGLNEISSTGKVTRFRHDERDPSGLCHDNIWALLEDRSGRIWIGTDGGLCVFDPRRRVFQRQALDFESAYVNTLVDDGRGGIWIGAAGLAHVNPETGAVTKHTDGALNVQAVHADSSGTVWFGTEFTGLWKLDRASGEAVPFPSGVASGAGLTGEAVRVIHPGKDGKSLWLGTDMGLVRFDVEEENFEGPSFAGMPGSQVYAILEDPKGMLWVATNQILARIDTSSGDVLTFDETDGTGNGEYNRRAAFADASGRFYLGGLDGLTLFEPAAMTRNSFVPPVAITGISVSGSTGTRTIHPDVAGDVPVTITPREHTLVIDFAALNFTSSAKNQYAYRLEGFDREWVQAGSSRQARYMGIPPGRYTFYVKGSNNDGVWNETGTAIAVKVEPSFWQTWWFRLAVLALGLVLAASLYQYRVGHLLAMERMRMRIAADLHDDVGTGLSSIALISDLVKGRPSSPHRDDLNQISRIARELVEGLRDIVWFVDPDHDRPEDFVRKLKRTAAASLNGTDYELDITLRSALEKSDMEFRRNLFLIYKEALANVARHAEAGHVHIRIEEEGDAISMAIVDDGIGFGDAEPRGGNGLGNMRKRAAQMGGNFQIRSEIGNGTTLLFRARITRTRDTSPGRRRLR